MNILFRFSYINMLGKNAKTGKKPTTAKGWEEVPPKKGKMGCFGRERYLMILGRTFYKAVRLEGWDVGREEENCNDRMCCLKVERSPGRILGWANAGFLLEEISFFYPFTTLPCISAWQYLHT
jgi:hypothetical protein